MDPSAAVDTMATHSATNPDTLVTLKINIEGTNRRFKLPLRDLGASTLPGKLRALLNIPPSYDTVFERYSDSAAAFVTLDPANAPVYKQLYRAAKAKLKLRLKVTVTQRDAVIPKPATVEDEVPNSAEETPVSARQVSSEPTPSPVVITTLPPASNSSKKSQMGADNLANLSRDLAGLSIFTAPLALRKAECPGESSDPVPSPAVVQSTPPPSDEVPVTVTRGDSAREKWFAEVTRLSSARQSALRNPAEAPCPAMRSAFSVYCNSCKAVIPNEHYHCGTCDEGDYDLCTKCVDAGVVCSSEDHWLIKRFLRNGEVITSTTERIAPKAAAADSKTTLVEPVEEAEAEDEVPEIATRTCNSCIQEWPEEQFVTCTSCDDYDLCIPCHLDLSHGHDPKHVFVPAVPGTKLDLVAETLLGAGRNRSHNAICDGCDKYIYGVRHKCVDCPDWDYCSACFVNASFVHPLHKFVPLYEPMEVRVRYGECTRPVRHFGIYCDGPLCNSAKGVQSYISGDRYKCAVCHDTDFCANCEANPSNPHNKTHPLIKFKTPVRNVSVTTMGDHDDGRPMPVMGDRHTRSKSTETTPAPSANAATQVQTVADLQPTETKEAAPQVVEAKELPATINSEEDLVAHFVTDTVADGTTINADTVFEQTWYLRNGGQTTWPAGCTVKFTGGDNMCAVDPQHPASVHELASAGESTTCYTEVAPGQEAGFTVLLRAPSRPGTYISYWRLTSPSGHKFGHRLWCDVRVEAPAPEVQTKKELEEEAVQEPKSSAEGSQMIFPKLEKESPESSIRVDSVTSAEPMQEEQDEFEEFADASLDNETEDGFMTDEEYDILDASDEEYLAEQEKAAKK